MEAITPYSIFVEIFIDQIMKDPTHPAYQPQDATGKQIARGLWAVLNEEQKVRSGIQCNALQERHLER